MRKPFYVLAALTILAGLLLRGWKPGDPRVLSASEINPHETWSNILPEDYVGPAKCAECHATQFKLWSNHAHSRMNQNPSDATVLGDFNDRTLQLPQASVQFTKRNGTFLMNVMQDGKLLRSFAVTRTVGSRYMQMYIGVQRIGPEPPDDGSYHIEHKLPFGYWFRLNRWLPTDYFDGYGDEVLERGIPVVKGVDSLEAIAYRQSCMNCHNTFAYSFRIFRNDLVGFPDATVQAALKPLAERLEPTVHVPPDPLHFERVSQQLDPDKHLVTLGISCEACHFGGRQHVQDPQDLRFMPRSPFIRIKGKEAAPPITGERSNPATLIGICAQCHSAVVELFPNGACTANSREAFDWHSGACSAQMRCVSCHEPHTAGPLKGGPPLAKQLALCAGCHQQYAEPASAAAHSRHPAGADVSCLDCHMPRYNQGLDEVVRTHRIAAPVEGAMAAKGMANACNLCHLDRSMHWTLNELDRGWQRRMSPGPDWQAAYGGNLDQPVGEVWLKSASPRMRLVAADAYARSPLGKAMLPRLLPALNDSTAVNRAYALIALQRVGDGLIDVKTEPITAPPAERNRRVQELLNQLEQRPKPKP